MCLFLFLKYDKYHSCKLNNKPLFYRVHKALSIGAWILVTLQDKLIYI